MKICGCTLPYEQCCGAIKFGPRQLPEVAVGFLTEEQKKQLRGLFQPHPWTPHDLDGVHA